MIPSLDTTITSTRPSQLRQDWIARICVSLRNYVSISLRRRAFAYALVVVPISSLYIPLPEVQLENSTTSPLDTLPSIASMTDASLILDEPITIVFDEIAPDVSVMTHPRTPTISTWNSEHTELTITPKSVWEPNTAYALALSAPGVTADQNAPAMMYNFRTQGYPQIASHAPKSDEKNVVITEGSELTVIFDRDLSDYDVRAIGRDSLPVRQVLDKHTRTLTITFTEDIPDAKDVDFIVYTKHHSESVENFYPIDTVVFRGRPPQPSAWPRNRSDRVNLSLERTIPKVATGKYIDINLEAHLTTLFEDGVAVESFVNSPGAADTPTLTGEFKIENKGIKPLSRSFGVYLPYWMAFTPDGLYGIHDLVEWPADHPDYPDSPLGGKESVASIDAAVSPGCVRHDSQTSRELYAWAEVGTPVIIY